MPLHRTRDDIAVSSRGLGLAARRNSPLFRRIVTNRIYATRLVRAIQARNLDLVESLIHLVVPGAAASVGSGFESDINFRNQIFGFGTFRPGQAIRTADIRCVARIMLPIIVRIGSSQAFRLRILRLFRQRREDAILRAIRNVSGSSRLVSLTIDQFGFAAVVQLPNGKRYNAIFAIQL